MPGNHDVSLANGGLSSAELQNIYNKWHYENHLDIELLKQKNFLNFAKGNRCFTENQVLCQQLCGIGNLTFEINMINTAIFSILEEDKGLHYFPEHLTTKLSAPTGADFVFTIMHHPPEWYNAKQKNDLEKTIMEKSSLIFLGHEHYHNAKSIRIEDSKTTQIVCGGKLANKADWSESSFYAVLMDIDEYRYTIWKFNWNKDEKIYQHSKSKDYTMEYKPSIEKRLVIDEEYGMDFLADPKRGMAANINDYFVFPRLEKEEVKESKNVTQFLTMDDFLKEIETNKRIVVAGAQDTGKTTLIKQLFLKLSRDKAVIFCDTGEIFKRKPEKLIKSLFEDIYGESSSDYIRFQQLPKSEKALIIDDIDRIDTNQFKDFLNGIQDQFGYFIFSTKSVLELNIIERLKVSLESVSSFSRYKIMPVYSDKQREIVEKITNQKIEDSNEAKKAAAAINLAIKQQKRLLNFDLSFLIQYVEYFCKNLGEFNTNDGNIFGKVFEANIITSIAKKLPKKMTVDKIFILFSKLAYYIHFEKAYPIEYDKIKEIVDKYNQDYGSDVDCDELLEIALSSKIFAEFNQSKRKYKFSSRNYLAFFVARELNRRYNETQDDSDLKYILRYSCFSINADILLFITYITDNPKILRLILDIAISNTNDWIEFDAKENVPQFLVNIKQQSIAAPDANEKKLTESKEIENDSQEARDEFFNTTDIYDYSDDEVDTEINQMIRAISLMITVSKCLPNFEHMMFKEDKTDFVKLIYEMPNKIFYRWADAVDKVKSEIIEYFIKQSENEFGTKKIPTEEEILEALQWNGLSLLLDLYNMTIFNAARENTEQYLSNYDYESKRTYKVQKIMLLGNRGKIEEFLKLCEKTLDEEKDITSKTLVYRVIRHALIFMDNIPRQTRQSMYDKYFPSPTARRNLLIQHNKNAGNK